MVCFRRFTLRTLLVVMTGVCAWLGFLTYRASLERQALDVVVKYGGSVGFDWFKTGHLRALGIESSDVCVPPDQVDDLLHDIGPRPESVWRKYLGGFLGDEYFQHIRYIHIPAGGVWAPTRDITPTDLLCVSRLPDLRHITLRKTTLGDEHFRALMNCDSLQSITLIEVTIEGQGIVELADVDSLTEVTLGYCDTSDELISRLRESNPAVQVTILPSTSRGRVQRATAHPVQRR